MLGKKNINLENRQGSKSKIQSSFPSQNNSNNSNFNDLGSSKEIKEVKDIQELKDKLRDLERESKGFHVTKVTTQNSHLNTNKNNNYSSKNNSSKPKQATIIKNNSFIKFGVGNITGTNTNTSNPQSRNKNTVLNNNNISVTVNTEIKDRDTNYINHNNMFESKNESNSNNINTVGNMLTSYESGVSENLKNMMNKRMFSTSVNNKYSFDIPFKFTEKNENKDRIKTEKVNLSNSIKMNNFLKKNELSDNNRNLFISSCNDTYINKNLNYMNTSENVNSRCQSQLSNNIYNVKKRDMVEQTSAKSKSKEKENTIKSIQNILKTTLGGKLLKQNSTNYIKDNLKDSVYNNDKQFSVNMNSNVNTNANMKINNTSGNTNLDMNKTDFNKFIKDSDLTSFDLDFMSLVNSALNTDQQQNLIQNKISESLLELSSINGKILNNLNTSILNHVNYNPNSCTNLINQDFNQCFNYISETSIKALQNIENGVSQSFSKMNSIHKEILDNLEKFIQAKNKIRYNELTDKDKVLLDENFIVTINQLSAEIRELIKNTKGNIKSMSSSSEIMNEQFLTTKIYTSELNSQINLLVSNLNQTKLTSSKQTNQSVAQYREKTEIKEKFKEFISKIDQIGVVKENFDKKIKCLDNNLSSFYNEAKLIFRKIKALHINSTSNQINIVNNETSTLNKRIDNLSYNTYSSGFKNNKTRPNSTGPFKRLVEDNTFYDKEKDKENDKINTKKSQTEILNIALRQENSELHEQILSLKCEIIEIKRKIEANNFDNTNNNYQNNQNNNQNNQNNSMINNSENILNNSNKNYEQNNEKLLQISEYTLNFIKFLDNFTFELNTSLKKEKENLNFKDQNSNDLKKELDIKKKELLQMSNDVLKFCSIEDNFKISNYEKVLKQTIDKYTEEKKMILKDLAELNNKYMKLEELYEITEANLKDEKSASKTKDSTINTLKIELDLLKNKITNLESEQIHNSLYYNKMNDNVLFDSNLKKNVSQSSNFYAKNDNITFNNSELSLQDKKLNSNTKQVSIQIENITENSENIDHFNKNIDKFITNSDKKEDNSSKLNNSNSIKILNEEIKQLKLAVKTKEEYITSVQNLNTEYKAEISALKSNINNKNEELIKKSYENLKKLHDDKCKEFNEIKEKEKHLYLKLEKLTAIESENKVLKDNMGLSSEKFIEIKNLYETKINEFNSLKGEYNNVNDQLKELKIGFNTQKINNNNLQNSINHLNDKVKDLEKANDIKNQTIEYYKTNLELREKEIQELNENQRLYNLKSKFIEIREMNFSFVSKRKNDLSVFHSSKFEILHRIKENNIGSISNDQNERVDIKSIEVKLKETTDLMNKYKSEIEHTYSLLYETGLADEYQVKNDSLPTIVKTLEGEIKEKLKDFDDLDSQYKEISLEKDNLREELKISLNLNTQKDMEFKLKIDELKSLNESANKELNKKEELIKKLENGIKDKEIEITNLKIKIENEKTSCLNNKVDEKNTIDDLKTQYINEINNKQEIINKQEKEIKDMITNIGNRKKDLEVITDEKLKLEKENTYIKKQITEINNSLEISKKINTDLERNQLTLENEIKDLKESKSNAEKEYSLVSLKMNNYKRQATSEIENLTEENSNLQQKILNLEKEKNEFDNNKINSTNQKLVEENKLLNSTITNLKKELTVLKEEKQFLENEFNEKLNELNDEYEKKMEELKNHYEESQSQLSSVIKNSNLYNKSVVDEQINFEKEYFQLKQDFDEGMNKYEELLNKYDNCKKVAKKLKIELNKLRGYDDNEILLTNSKFDYNF